MSFGFGAASAPAAGASLFGAPQPQQSAPSLFGAAQQQQTTSLFGNTQQQSAPSLFGAPASSQSLFGAPASSQSLFGAPASSQALFGAPASSQSLFGAPASSQSLFGAPASSQPSQSLFGAPASSQSLFGAPASSQSLFGATPAPSLFGPAAQQQQQLQQQQQMAQLPRALTELVDRLNPMHAESKMHAALYNVVPPSDISRYTRPSTMDEVLWDSAVANNPDPSRMVPVQANNFDDLLRRSEMQGRRLAEHGAVLSRIEETLTKVENDVETELSSRLGAYRRRHRELARKLLRLASVVDMETARDDRATLTAGETERKKRIDTIARALAEPAEFKDKLADLVELAERHVVGRRAGAEVEIRDGRAAAAVRDLLAEQLRGIQYLGEVCDRADRDIGIIGEGLGER